MSDASEDKLATLDRLITKAEERRIDQMVLIGTLVMEEKPVGQAIDDLEEIEDLLQRMRAQRVAEAALSYCSSSHVSASDCAGS